MSEYGAITASVRRGSGKGVARSLRRQGLIPGIMYGRGKESLPISVDPRLFGKATDPQKQWNTLFHVTVQEDGKQSVVEPCMVADVQIDSLRQSVIHVDFLRVDPQEEIVRKVPMRVTGRSPGVVMGGRLKIFRRWLRVAAKPAEMPVEVVVDISSVEGGQSLRVKDLTLDNARVVEAPERRLLTVDMPKVKAAENEGDKAEKGKGKK